MWGDCPVHGCRMDTVTDEYDNEYESCPEPDCGYHIPSHDGQVRSNP